MCVYECTLVPDYSVEKDQVGRGETSRELASPSSRTPPLHLKKVEITRSMTPQTIIGLLTIACIDH